MQELTADRAIKKMMEFAGLKVGMKELLMLQKNGVEWYSVLEISPKKAKEFERWFRKEYRKGVPRASKKAIDGVWGNFWLQYGLKTEQ